MVDSITGKKSLSEERFNVQFNLLCSINKAKILHEKRNTPASSEKFEAIFTDDLLERMTMNRLRIVSSLVSQEMQEAKDYIRVEKAKIEAEHSEMHPIMVDLTFFDAKISQMENKNEEALVTTSSCMRLKSNSTASIG